VVEAGVGVVLVVVAGRHVVEVRGIGGGVLADRVEQGVGEAGARRAVAGVGQALAHQAPERGPLRRAVAGAAHHAPAAAALAVIDVEAGGRIGVQRHVGHVAHGGGVLPAGAVEHHALLVLGNGPEAADAAAAALGAAGVPHRFRGVGLGRGGGQAGAADAGDVGLRGRVVHRRGAAAAEQAAAAVVGAGVAGGREQRHALRRHLGELGVLGVGRALPLGGFAQAPGGADLAHQVVAGDAGVGVDRAAAAVRPGVDVHAGRVGHR